MSELKRFENDLKGSDELRKKLDETAARVKNEGRVRSDGELLVAAAKELGYVFSIADLEKSKAEAEPMDPADFEQVAGGQVSEGAKRHELCFTLWDQGYVDEYNHNVLCAAAWHCFTAMIHTQTEDQNVTCWSNYKCIFINEEA